MAGKRINDEWVIDRLDSLWPNHTAAFARLLIELRRDFDGDLDAVLVLSVVSSGTLGDVWQEILLNAEQNQNAVHSATNTQSVAQITGIARETVRRKLSHLEAKGWLARDHDGNWTPTRQAAIDLRPASIATISYLQTVFNAVLGDGKGGTDG